MDSILKSFGLVLLVVTFVSASAPRAGAALPTAPDTAGRGPHMTSTSEYRFSPSIDPDVLERQATEVWGRVFWPKDLLDPATGKKQKYPLLVFLHGNHGTCGSGDHPRNDNSCEYTYEGVCPDGYVVTPNHEGYNYVAEHLASWGYIVVSVNANRGITCGGGNSDDWGLVLARGRLVLKHLQLWRQWSSTGAAPASLGQPDQFIDAVDMSQVGLMGHSRGGEGVRAALNLYRDPGSPWVTRIPGLDVKAIYEIGAVDGQSNRVLDAPSVAWNQTLPLCDGDVSDLQGRMPFERMMDRFSRKSEAETRPSPKSLTMVWGANHNYFNTEWQTSDSYGCTGAPTQKAIFDETQPGSLQQQTVALQSMTAFFRAHVGSDRDAKFAQSFDPAFALPSQLTSVTPIDRDYAIGFDLAKNLRVDDFTAATGSNPAGPKNQTSNVTIDHKTTSEPPVADIAWDHGAADHFHQTNLAEAGHGADVAAFDFLDFRVGHIMQDAEKELLNPIDFRVQLVDEADQLSAAVAISSYTALLGPPSDNADLTQTVRIPLSVFAFAGKKIRGVRFVFDQTAEGHVRLAHVRFGVSSDKIAPLADPFQQMLAIRRATRILQGNMRSHTTRLPPLEMDATPAETTPPYMIQAPANHLVTPFDLPQARRGGQSQRASWMPPRKVRQSLQLKGQSAVELSVQTNGSFPVQDALPVLNIENHLFVVSRYSSNGKTYALTFSIPVEDYRRLPEMGRAQVQYGLKIPARTWSLPDFSKANNRELIGD